jgi:hypothetical protein
VNSQETDVGCYLLLMNQGTPHGNGVAPSPDGGNTLPIIHGMERLTDDELAVQLRIYFHAFGGALLKVGGDDRRKTFQSLFQGDLRFLGGRLPPGMPNSQAWGIQRSSGLAFASFARNVRADLNVRRAWHVMCRVVGRISPWEKRALHGRCYTSFDGMLITHAKDNYTGLDKHVDTYADECGQWQGLFVAHPPFPGYDRTGLALSFYPETTEELRKDFLRALISRWSTSPDMDQRMSPLPSLGSGNAQEKQRRVFGGRYYNMCDVKDFTLDELEEEVKLRIRWEFEN